MRRVEPGGFTKVSALGVEEQRVWVIVDITSPHALWHHLGEAYRVNARFLLREAAPALRVPASAVFFEGDTASVFRVANGKAHRTRVVVGLQGEGWAEIRKGLSVGETVIVHPDRSLEGGDRVRDRAR